MIRCIMKVGKEGEAAMCKMLEDMRNEAAREAAREASRIKPKRQLFI